MKLDKVTDPREAATKALMISAKTFYRQCVGTEANYEIPFAHSIITMLNGVSGNLFDFRYAIMQYLLAVSEPEISAPLKNKMCSAHYEDFQHLLQSILFFLEDLQEPYNKALLTAAAEIGYNSDYHRTTEEIIKETRRYELLIEAERMKSDRN